MPLQHGAGLARHGLMTTTVEQSVTANVPAERAYRHWLRFEEFPAFLEHVEDVEQQDENHYHWRAKIGSREREWDAEIVERIPDKRIAWRSTSGARHAGVVTFHHLERGRCRIMLQLEFEPEGAIEQAGSMLRIPQQQIAADLQRFATWVEEQARSEGEQRAQE